MTFDGWAWDDFDGNVNSRLHAMESKLLGMNFNAYDFSWGRADKPHKYGWEVSDHKGNTDFAISLKGEVRRLRDDSVLGHIGDEGILQRMRDFA